MTNQDPSLLDVAARFRALEPEVTDPEMFQFAQFLADRIESRGGGEANQHSFLLLSSLAIYDLRRGVDGVTGEEVVHELAGRDPKTYDRLNGLIPRLGDVGVSSAFGQSLQNAMVELGLISAPEAADTPTLQSGEIIAEPITDIQTAHELIIEGARTSLLELDWASHGLTSEQVGTAFDQALAFVLRQSPFRAPINVLSARLGTDYGLITETLPHQKMALADQVWLTMLTPSIPGDYATATRDMVYLKSIECVTAFFPHLDPEQLLFGFARDVDGPVMRAGTRLGEFVLTHPELTRPNADG